MLHAATVVDLAPAATSARRRLAILHQTEDQHDPASGACRGVRQLVDQAARDREGRRHLPPRLEKIGGLLATLASRAELFPQDEFPLGADGGIYRLSEDPDHRFALYASAGGAGKKVPPHNHTTWAIIAGVHGAERNVGLRPPRQRRAGRTWCKLREAPAKEKTLRSGDFICLPAGRLPSHRDAGRLGQRAAPSLLRAQPRAPARPRRRSTWRAARPSASWPRPRS